MKHVITASVTIFLFGTALYFHDQSRRRGKRPDSETIRQELIRNASTNGSTVRAPGRIEGRTEEIQLRARMTEQISAVHVQHGDHVRAGQVLVSLDSDRLVSERDLAAARASQVGPRRSPIGRPQRSVRAVLIVLRCASSDL